MCILPVQRTFSVGVCSWPGAFENLRQQQQVFVWIRLWDLAISGRLLINI